MYVTNLCDQNAYKWHFYQLLISRGFRRQVLTRLHKHDTHSQKKNERIPFGRPIVHACKAWMFVKCSFTFRFTYFELNRIFRVLIIVFVLFKNVIDVQSSCV